MFLRNSHKGHIENCSTVQIKAPPIVYSVLKFGYEAIAFVEKLEIFNYMRTVTDSYALKVLTLFKNIFDKGLGKTPSKIEFESEYFNLMENIKFQAAFTNFFCHI
jgi:hypothetical protein